MNRGFYLKMAAGNIRKNKHIYLPYLLAVSLVMALYYILTSIEIMVGASGMQGTRTMTTILRVCIPIAGGFALIILFYVNGFVMKQRKKEFSLYNILGMEKRHLGRLMVIEVLLVAVCSLILGVLAGALFSQLMFLVFYQLIRMPIKLTFTIPLEAVGGTVKLYGAGFLLVMVYDVFSVLRTNPIRMLQESRQGEREPKARWLLVLIGVLTLGGGYYIAQSVETPMDALGWFFVAAFLVIIGTYCLFMAGSIAILKFLKRWEHFYYKPANFISVSGMIYRMKQNAVGLASICILATTVMATMASCLSMFLGLEDGIKEEYPRRVLITSMMESDERSSNPNEGIYPEPLMREAAQKYTERCGLTVKNELAYATFSTVLGKTEDGYEVAWGETYGASGDLEECIRVRFLIKEDYVRNTGISLDLEKGEVAVCENKEGLIGDTLKILGKSYKVKEQVPAMEASGAMGMGVIKKSIQVIFSDLEELESFHEFYAKGYKEYFGLDDDQIILDMTYVYLFDVDGEAEELSEFYANMRDSFQSVPHLATVNNIDAIREEFFQDYGTVMFVGIFLTIMFLVATVLIIYYKQITEGYDDRRRFRIMQEVGMSSREVKKTIQRQVLQVFFLPLGLAVIHIAVAFKSMVTMLSLFAVYNKTLFAGCVVLTAAVFGLIYFIVYEITAGTYYKIVKV